MISRLNYNSRIDDKVRTRKFSSVLPSEANPAGRIRVTKYNAAHYVSTLATPTLV
jgi:hypothetical protein